MTSNLLNNQLLELTYTHLDREMYTNAIFFGERLLIEFDCEEVRYALSKGYFGI